MMPLYVGDEVDYSAPYLTVENGELVTKYPVREHEAEPLTWIFAVVAAAIIAVFLFLRRRRNMRSERTD